MTILAFYPVCNELNWERDTFNAMDDSETFEKMWENRSKINVRFFNMETKSYSNKFSQDGIYNANDLEESYNDEDFDGGWWVRALMVGEVFVDEVISKHKHKYEFRPGTLYVEDILLFDKERFGGEINVPLYVSDGYASGNGVEVKYPMLSELTEEQIEEMDEQLGGRISDSGVVYPEDALLVYGKVVSFVGIMNTDNCHDEDLVRRINVAWASRQAKFKPILQALYERDIDEITDSDSFQIRDWTKWPEYEQGKRTEDWSAYNSRALAVLKTQWDIHAQNYLMHIADDGDLQTILEFLR